MIPSIEKKEWYGLVTGAIEPRLSSRLLKIKLSILRRKVIRGLLTPKQAIEELVKDCEKHYDLYKQDIQLIFNKKKKENIGHL
jgi:hypothetical protein